MLFFIISLVLLLSTFKIRTRKRIYKIFFFFIKLFFLPIRLVGFFIKRYFKNREIENKILLKEKIKRERIENRIAEIKKNLPANSN